MQELIENIERISFTKAKNLVLLDTCFIIDSLSHHKKLDIKNMAVTSFNMEELLHIEHGLPHEIRKEIRNFFKKGNFKIIDIPVHPGNSESEKEFVKSIDNELLLKIPDPSDAVLIAAAVKTNSIILTKDKHHLFTTTLENFLNKYNLKVFKNINTLE